MPRKVVFSIALNGYGFGYRSCLKSHREYAHRIGAEHVVVSKPNVDDPSYSAWLKVSLLRTTLQDGYDWVAYIDADCMVSVTAPDFSEHFDGEEGSVFMGKGWSGRINSGVIFARRNEESVRFFQEVIDSAENPVPDEDRKDLKFENGNIIYIARVRGGVTIMGQEWNNISDPALPDNIRHYTGKMRDLYTRSLTDRILFKISRMVFARIKAAPVSRSVGFVEKLEDLTQTVYASSFAKSK